MKEAKELFNSKVRLDSKFRNSTSAIKEVELLNWGFGLKDYFDERGC